MKAAFRATKPSECWDWLSGPELAQLAMMAFRKAKHASHPPQGEGFLAGGSGWSDPAAFAETLTYLLELHLRAAAHAAGIPGHEDAPVQMLKWPLPGKSGGAS